MRVGGKTHDPVGLLPGKCGPGCLFRRVGKMSLPPKFETRIFYPVARLIHLALPNVLFLLDSSTGTLYAVLLPYHPRRNPPKFSSYFFAGMNCLNTDVSIHLWLYPNISYSTEISKLSTYFSDICKPSFLFSLQLNICRHILSVCVYVCVCVCVLGGAHTS
jgi:hypothetical protein